MTISGKSKSITRTRPQRSEIRKRAPRTKAWPSGIKRTNRSNPRRSRGVGVKTEDRLDYRFLATRRALARTYTFPFSSARFSESSFHAAHVHASLARYRTGAFFESNFPVEKHFKDCIILAIIAIRKDVPWFPRNVPGRSTSGCFWKMSAA